MRLFTFEQQVVKWALHRLTRVVYTLWCPNTFREPAGDPREALAPGFSVTTTENFTGIERRRSTSVRGEQREAGEIAVFHELGKALTSSLQLDQVLRTIMEKIDEFLRPDTWSLLLVDEAKQDLYFELAVGKGAQALKDVRIKMG
ncbi:MAG TPA: hypothetical protein VNZ56_00865 [Verrucomicrobiae bacterium]|nr:hypothetical protein [Verrucomicrobiae bacterium]